MRALDTIDPAARSIVTAIRDAIVETASDELVGLFVYGSAATGDFEPNVSDIDLIAVLQRVPDDQLVARLRAMHDRLVLATPAWQDRIDLDYISAQGLAGCRSHSTTVARISPGEPFHVLEAGREFILDWHPARQHAITIVGPRIDSVIPEIPEAEYLDEVRRYLARFPDRFDDDASAGSRSYAVLTMCRGLYALRHGERLTKRAAGLRARAAFPRWARVIDRATGWRDPPASDEDDDDPAHVHEARSFVTEMARLLDLDRAE
ncbi:MAG TPA: aminoglycoside adenylyltransferase domain-containing protein [Actinomycetota bacterium]|nr:aminoglycoside adenylyltransferase domain-containing protein [Actinomycetota bacterium]